MCTKNLLCYCILYRNSTDTRIQPDLCGDAWTLKIGAEYNSAFVNAFKRHARGGCICSVPSHSNTNVDKNAGVEVHSTVMLGRES